jgi:hypothetical protein
MSYYRIHSAGESLETLLDPRRPDGWVADDESLETQPLGISCCATLAALAAYQRGYLMNVEADDVLVELTGELSDDDDRDEHARRLIVNGYRVVCSGAAWNAVLAAAEQLDDIESELDEAGDDGALYDSTDEVWGDYLGAYDSEQTRQLVQMAA